MNYLTHHKTIVSILTISFVAVLAYGLLIPWLGIYWDEIFFMWAAQAGGALGLAASLAYDRPGLGMLWAIQYSLIGQNILVWHLLALVTRIASGLAVLWLFRELWPERRFAAFAAAILFTIYPGFLEQPIAFMYQMTFLTMTLSVVSLAATIRSQKPLNRRARWFWIGLAMVSLALEVLFLEYFLGLELLRFILLWYVISRSTNLPWLRRIGAVMKQFIPYLIVSGVFLFWRVFIFKSERLETDIGMAIFDRIRASPFIEILRLPLETLRDFFESAIFAWFVPTHAIWSGASFFIFAIAMVLFVITVLVVGGSGYLVQKRDDTDETVVQERWAWQSLLIGILAVPGSIFFVLISGTYLLLLDFKDRYTLVMLLPVIFVIIGVCYLAIRSQYRPLLIALLVGFGVSTHFVNADDYRRDWFRITDMWWQTAWRVPQFADDTMLIVENVGSIRFREDYTVWGAANLIYRYEDKTTDLDGFYLADDVMTRIRRQQKEGMSLRGIHLDRDSRNTVILVYQQEACVRFIDPQRQELPQEPSTQLLAAAAYSHIERILFDASPALPPTQLFGPEPPHNWCFYFQKADLARQSGDYEQVVALFGDAKDRNLNPTDPTEWYPFIESFVVLDRPDEATSLIDNVLSEDELLISDVCRMLRRLDQLEDYGQLSCPSA